MRLTAVLAFLAVSLVVGAWAAPSSPDPTEPDRLLFLLEYIGADYGAAVSNGAVANPFEYAEMARLSRFLVEHCDVLIQRGAPKSLRTSLLRLEQLVRELASWEEVRTLSTRLVSSIVGGARSVPTRLPRRTWFSASSSTRRTAQLATARMAAAMGSQTQQWILRRLRFESRA